MKHLTSLSLLGVVLGISGAQAAPTITTVSPQGLQSAIKKQRGKVVLVNFWATWCAPCVAELPALKRLEKQQGKRGLVILLVSADAASSKPLVLKTLSRSGHGRSFLLGGDMVEFFDRFDPKFKDAVALPRTYLYNRRGVRVKAIENDHTTAQYAKFVAPYL